VRVLGVDLVVVVGAGESAVVEVGVAAEVPGGVVVGFEVARIRRTPSEWL
jgi:hypothetical protein